MTIQEAIQVRHSVRQYKISSCPQLIERIQQLGFLPETTDKQLNKLIK